MPSNVVAQIVELTNKQPHTNADRLELFQAGGWQIVCGKDLYNEGDRVIYITPDSLITEDLANALEIHQHTQSVKNEDGSFVTNDTGQVMRRVRQAKLRGEPSFGTTIPSDMLETDYMIDIYNLELGTNLADQIGILKYEPRMRASAGDAEVDHVLFTKYTNIENLRNYPNVLVEGEEVVLTEKLHGQNVRVGLIDGELMAGSHGLRRKRPDDLKSNAFWYPLEDIAVTDLLYHYRNLGHKQVILYGESYGTVQKGYNYGIKNGAKFRAFDLFVDGRYVSHKQFVDSCDEFGVDTVPILTTMPYSFEAVSDYAENLKTSALSDEHGIEGIVVRPATERYDHKVGRVILKYLSNSYLFNDKKSDFTEV